MSVTRWAENRWDVYCPDCGWARLFDNFEDADQALDEHEQGHA